MVNSPCVMYGYAMIIIFQLLQKLKATVNHIFRESNMAADFLANLGCNLARLVIFDSNNMPRKLRGIVRVDGGGLCNLRLVKV